MKLKTNYLASFLILLASWSVCSAQQTSLRIEQNGKVVSITQSLVDDNGERVLFIDEHEAVRVLTEAGVTLTSSNPAVVAVLSGTILVAVAPDGQATITASDRDGRQLDIVGLDELTVRVQTRDNGQQITAQSTFLTYKTVKDNFGKRFAKSYFVIQVDIRNEKLDQQFIVQTIDVLMDPNQCEKGRALYTRFPVTECRRIFDTYFRFPSVQQAVRREEVIAVGKADLNRSNRNLGFRILAFSASMGTILSGFNGVLGPDGVKGMNVLGTTVSAAAGGLFPDTAPEKLENLRNSLPTEDVIIKSQESKTFNIFIPTERVFWEDSWARYIRDAPVSDFDTYKLKAVLDLALLSSATGVLVDNNAQTVKVQSSDRVEEQVAQFQLGEIPKSFLATGKQANQVLAALKSDLEKNETREDAEEVLRMILSALQDAPGLKLFFAKEPGITINSDGETIRLALFRIRGQVLISGNDRLVNRINEIIIKASQ